MQNRFSLPKASDINAGFLVALVGIPQCLAYAMLSGLPPMYGLVTAAVPGIIAALAGKSAGVTVGPTNTTGLIILASLTPWANQPELLLTAMATLAFLAGLARLAIVLAKGERIFDFVPEAVMVGFATGAAIIIALMQLDEMLGAPFSGVRNVIDEIQMLATYPWAKVSLASFSLALIALLSVVLGKKYAPRWPIPLIVLIASIALVWSNSFGVQQWWFTLADTTEVSDGWPPLATQLPDWQMIQALIVPGFAVAFIGSLELIVTLRNRQEQRLLKSELSSQGLANIAGAFSGAFPASTSLTRSVLLDIGGAQSRWAPFIAAVVMIPIILFGGEAIRNIPQPVISGLLIATALSMLKIDAIKQMLKVNTQTRMLFLVTIISTLILNFHEAILLGALLGIVLFLVQTSQTQIRVFNLTAEGGLILQPSSVALSDVTPTDANEKTDVTEQVLLQISGSLHFAAARQLPERLSALLVGDCQKVILDLSHAHHSRVAAIQSLLRFSEECSFRNIRVEIIGIPPDLLNLALTMGVRLPLGNQQLTMTLGEPEA